MSELELETLAGMIAEKMSLGSADRVLWNTKDIAAATRRNANHVNAVFLPDPDFPAPIHLPSAPPRNGNSKGRSHALYRPAEVIKWAVAHQIKI